ncbi:tRNA (32-2'-O)-methyltransferase regulator THADA [Heteronotia binoei]|uniref:tRNA (32-2'-O)-methyltransferase regulator THADA n=1 Tax=Heteronotia binoei TaxID=13085 RepID=UPI002930B0F8|nr:tRNA (32-2'-O)-methyltransferase regulator THADA [Heteronotia binoei]XP_060103501.1 tRNA (32-2'-O)-methyltransferase regulator THADA [Heteronotia binoei]XP_060103510.1 tRNA (32-2'-O)-methyltransferase regulator THADA [Heteronotia binoei]
MVLKKKKEMQVDTFILDQQHLERLQSFADSEGQNLASLLLHCGVLTDGIQQIHCIKQIVPLFQKMDTASLHDPMVKSCIEVLGVIYLSLDIKNPLKKVLASSLNGLPEFLMAEATHSIVGCLREELKATDLSQYRKIMENLVSCLENTNIGRSSLNTLFKEALQFLQKSLLEIEDENRRLSGNRIAQTRLMHDLLMGVKVSMMLIQKMQANSHDNLWKKLDSPFWKSMCGLLHSFTCFLINEEFLQTVRTAAGLALILFVKTMFEPAEKLPCLINDLLCGSLKCLNVPDWFVDSCGSLCTAKLSDSVLLFVCHGALAMLDWRDGCMGHSGEKLLLDISSVLLVLSTRLKESNMAASLSRILAIWTNSTLGALPSSSKNLHLAVGGNSDTIRKMLDYVYAHWEHPLDAVRHQTKLIFKNVLQIHQATIKGSTVKPDPFFFTLTESLLSLEWHVKGKYSSLGYLVECIGCDNVLAMDRTIPAQILDVMSDQSFAPYASDLLEIMFMNHKKHLSSVMEGEVWIDDWHATWVSPLLLILCDGNPEQTTYIIDYYLPKLLKCSPESLNYMIKILRTSAESSVGSSNTRGAFGALMACLRTARAHGHLQFTDILHDGLVSVGCTKQGLVHQHDQVRIDALGLLCESHRSTETISLEEMQLIKFFVRYNLNSQSPAVRQQICSLLKKLFCRIYESSQTIYRMQQMKPKDPTKQLKWNPLVILQGYKDFMSSLCDMLFGALFPGSSHPTSFTALTLLGIIAEIFPISEGHSPVLFQITQEVEPSRVQTLLHCFASTFEEVKVLAFEFLMKLHCALPYFQDPEKLQPLFQVAMQLSTSTKPYDCVTASYLLNFLIHQEGLLQVCFKNHLLLDPFQPGEDTSSDLVEKNALAVIKSLLENLEGEILQAEKSLLQAAASFPMYGRVHCITGTLHQLPLKNLTLIPEWKQMITKLILISYKLSAVVSPVVQSSSPEGLIPMDTDSDTSERLQLILREIQPCDTNDYFTEPKLLEEHSELDHANERLEDICTKIRGGEQQTCDVTAQMVLVCCWRSMKEISLLLGKLCQLLPLQAVPDPSDVLITEEQVKNIGEYFKHHLLKSRHRGAFELAYSGFVKLTEVFSRCDNESLHKLPQQWLYNVLEEIKSSNPSSKLCATRRSAGIPFYIQALLASEPKKGKTGLLKMTLEELISLTSPSDTPQSTIPQVHALNILRALFKDTHLGENIIPYVADGMQAAILGFTSSVWAVRNSSTLLFSTLITRIFGVKRGKDENSKKNRMTGREFFTRFPNLYSFLLNQLEVVTSTMDSESGKLKLHPSLFLLLLILGKLYPSPMDGAYSTLSMAPFIPFILKCGHSAVYRSREMAGRALVPFIMINQVPQTVRSLLVGLPDCTDPCVKQNAVHGTLVQVFHLLQSCLESKHRANSDFQQGLSDIISSVEAKLWLANRQNPCLVTRATYLDVLVLLNNYIGKSRIKGLEFQRFWEKMAIIVSNSELAMGIPYSSAVPGLSQYLQNITKLIISMLSVTADPGFANYNLLETGKATEPCLSIEHLLCSDFHEVRLVVLEATLLWLRQMSCKHMTEGGAKGLLALLPGLEETLLRIAVKEKNPECFCKVLEVLYCMDLRNVLLKTEDAVKINPRDFLHWIINTADTSNSIEIQRVSLKLASKFIVHLVQNWQEEIKSEVKLWIQIVTYCCKDEQQTDLRLAAADVLVNVAPFFLTNQNLLLGLSDTLLLWKCVIQLLQSEEQIVRDAAAGVIGVVLSQESIFRKKEFDFRVVNASMALDLTFSILCELLQLWNQTSAGIPVLLEWLLGKEDLKYLETTTLVENDYLFDKGQANFWAEKLTHARQLGEHLLLLTPVSHISPCDQEKLQQLKRSASDQSWLVTQLLKEMPPVPEFSRSAEFTTLAIQRERISICLKILALLDPANQTCRNQEGLANDDC